MTYNDQHRKLLQVFMQEGIVEESEVEALVIKLFNDNRISKIMSEINEQLQPISMMIRKAQCEITFRAYWVLVSTVLDDVTRFQDEFSKAQLSLLRNIFSEIITSSNGCIPSTTCLNFCPSLEIKLSKAEAEDFLSDIVKRNWLVYKNGYYYMGVRSITELMPYFRATYEGNLSTCCLCKQVIFHGMTCSHCQNLLHLYCFKNYATVHNPVKCPVCNNLFPTSDFFDV